MTLAEELQRLTDCEFIPDSDLTSLTTMRLTSRGDLIKIKTISGVQALLPILVRHQCPWIVVGWGANQILPACVSKLVIHLDFAFNSTTVNSIKDEYEFPASIGLNQLTSLAVKFGLKGWEVFTGVPASLGGAVYMNAGTNLGEIGDLVKRVTLVTKEGKLRQVEIGTGSFSYRQNHFVREGEVIVSVTLSHRGISSEIPSKIKEYLEYRRRTQPLTTKNCGCVFKNPWRELPAGKLIDLLGLKGLEVGGLRVSPKHANFIENFALSSWDDFQTLLNLIQSNVDVFYGANLELEVQLP